MIIKHSLIHYTTKYPIIRLVPMSPFSYSSSVINHEIMGSLKDVHVPEDSIKVITTMRANIRCSTLRQGWRYNTFHQWLNVFQRWCKVEIAIYFQWLKDWQQPFNVNAHIYLFPCFAYICDINIFFITENATH